MSHRPARINAEFARALSEIIRGLKVNIDGMVSVLGAEVTKDLKSCRAMVSIFGASDSNATLTTLNSNAGTIRRELASRFRHLKSVPEVTFVLDGSVEHGNRIEQILNEIKAED